MQAWIAPTLPSIRERERAVTENKYHGQTIIFSMVATDWTPRGGTITFNAWEFDSVESQIVTEYHKWFKGGGTITKWGVLTEL